MNMRTDNVWIRDSDIESLHAIASADIIAEADDRLVFFAIRDCQSLTKALDGLGLAQTPEKGTEDG